MALDVIFKSLEPTIKPPDNSINPILLASVAASDPCEAQFFSAQTFLGAVYGDPNGDHDRNSRAQTPMGSSRGNTPLMVRNPIPPQGRRKQPLLRVHQCSNDFTQCCPWAPSHISDLARSLPKAPPAKIVQNNWSLNHPDPRHMYTQRRL